MIIAEVNQIVYQFRFKQGTSTVLKEGNNVVYTVHSPFQLISPFLWVLPATSPMSTTLALLREGNPGYSSGKH